MLGYFNTFFPFSLASDEAKSAAFSVLVFSVFTCSSFSPFLQLGQMSQHAENYFDSQFQDDIDNVTNYNKIVGSLKTLIVMMPKIPVRACGVALNLPQSFLIRTHSRYLSSYIFNTTSKFCYREKCVTPFVGDKIRAYMKITKKNKTAFNPSELCTLINVTENVFAFHYIYHVGELIKVVPSNLSDSEKCHQHPYQDRQYADNFFYFFNKQYYDFYGRIVRSDVIDSLC